MVMAMSNSEGNPSARFQARRIGSLVAPRSSVPPPPAHATTTRTQTLCEYAGCFIPHVSNTAHMEAMRDLYGYND